MVPLKQGVTTRDATEADLPAILDIYNREVESGTATFDLTPRAIAEQRMWLKEHQAPYCAIVAVDGDEVVGFGSLSSYRPKRAYAPTTENTVYVRQDRQRQGIGMALLAELLRRARDSGFHTVIARITGGNEGSVEMHRRAGFELIGVEKEVGRKFDRWLDVVTMQLILDD